MKNNQPSIKALQKRIDQFSKKYKDKKILLYGAGSFFQSVYNELDFSKLNIVGIADKKFTNDNPKNFLGYRTYLPSEIDSLDVDFILVTVVNYLNIIINFYFKMCKDKKIHIKPLFKKNFLTLFKEFLKNL